MQYKKKYNNRPIRVSFFYGSPEISNYHQKKIEKEEKIMFHKTNQVSQDRSIGNRRLNQLEPKTKMNLGIRESTTWQTKRQNQGIETSLQSIDYSLIKPMFGWKKYTLLCGMENQLGDDGCTCKTPCKYQKKWTKHYRQINHKIYYELRQIPATTSNLQQIDKDINRTYYDCFTFQKQDYQLMLREILISYSVYDVQVGYVQGLNIVVAVLLYHIKNAQKTFWTLVDLMEQQELRLIYLQGFKQLATHCYNIKIIILAKVNNLATQMYNLDIQPSLFINGWILSLMGSCIPLKFMHLIIDNFRQQGWPFMYKLIITVLVYLKQHLMMAEDQAQFFTALSIHNSDINWAQIVQSSSKIQINDCYP